MKIFALYLCMTFGGYSYKLFLSPHRPVRCQKKISVTEGFTLVTKIILSSGSEIEPLNLNEYIISWKTSVLRIVDHGAVMSSIPKLKLAMASNSLWG